MVFFQKNILGILYRLLNILLKLSECHLEEKKNKNYVISDVEPPGVDHILDGSTENVVILVNIF